MKVCPNCEGPLIDVIDASDLSERHVEALQVFVQKYRKGAKEHGDLVRRKRWTKDTLSEEIDGAFYRIFDLLDILDEELEDRRRNQSNHDSPSGD